MKTIQESIIDNEDLDATSRCIELSQLAVNELLPQGKLGSDATHVFVHFLHEGKYLQVGSFVVPKDWEIVDVITFLASRIWENKMARMLEIVPRLDRLTISAGDKVDLMTRAEDGFAIHSYLVTNEGFEQLQEEHYEHP